MKNLLYAFTITSISMHIFAAAPAATAAEKKVAKEGKPAAPTPAHASLAQSAAHLKKLSEKNTYDKAKAAKLTRGLDQMQYFSQRANITDAALQTASMIHHMHASMIDQNEKITNCLSLLAARMSAVEASVAKLENTK